MAMIIGVTCNIFIVGINQIADVHIDKINKPYLPIPSGALSVQQAKNIVFTALFISLGLALYITPYLFGIIAFAATIGWAYSMPPLYLKQHHVTAALAIAIVRGVLLNAGGFLVFNYLVNNSLEMPENVKILTLFILAFSIVISWFKDLSDMEGDAKYNIKTFAILYSPKVALKTGILLVGLAYLFTIYMKWIDFFITENPPFETRVLLFGHIILFGLFIINALSIRLNQLQSIKKFYKRFWWFFFAEYVVYLVAYGAKV
jgi:homogentisate phytyltransferase/homogentisate geranylgeranyltransferase